MEIVVKTHPGRLCPGQRLHSLRVTSWSRRRRVAFPATRPGVVPAWLLRQGFPSTSRSRGMWKRAGPEIPKGTPR